VFNKQVGLAFQTITKHGEEGSDIRAMMVPDEGTIFFESDLSQAEARVVAILANDTKLNKMFSYGVDVHLVTTGWIEGCSPDELLDEFFALEDVTAIKELVHRVNQLMKTRISSEKRQIGKKFRHAGHYDMGKHEASKSAGLPEWRAGQILNKSHGSSVVEALEGVDSRLAAAKARLELHSIWELVLHVTAWQRTGLLSIEGGEYVSMTGDDDWPPVADGREFDFYFLLHGIA